ncbi:TetR family transcriptional regulator [Herbihabitans rhizosphaerae]|uniref:TetR family transcriptional regulator n=1 Tax=Herbihabitans rhizosphaerae TaxID=1872711 RepID=A0A4Q7KZ37_9PSEU|nr:TetR/AcrR family transcriptional regulator [Herbihabitans rhizosphaerae]RZS40952.1 TetR family transcriptional regulator [Herbihabitans rhizosphaerae]
MTSQRHSLRDDVLLDAARTCVLELGFRRTTLTEVARAASVSRMTLYRRFPDVRALLAALMTREFGALLARVAAAPAGASARERLTHALVDGVRALAADELMRAVLDRDPELLLPYVFERIGGVQRIVEEFVTGELKAGHDDASIRRADPLVQARSLFLVAQAFVLSMTPATSDVDTEALLAELRTTVDAALRPE